MMEDGLPKHGFVALDPGGYYLQFVRFNSHPENTELLAILNKLKSGYAEPQGPGARERNLALKATITSFYYRDPKTIQRFYKEQLGFNVIANRKRARIYQTSPSGFFRVVDGASSLHTPTDDIALKKGTMLSYFTNDTVEGWFDFIEAREDVELRMPVMSDREKLKAFSFVDYEGYAVEFDFFPPAPRNLELRQSLESNADLFR